MLLSFDFLFISILEIFGGMRRILSRSVQKRKGTQSCPYLHCLVKVHVERNPKACRRNVCDEDLPWKLL